ncbi:MAG: DEDD exonuclease domain-containing protein [Bacteroidetes bacterium]|nr:MAG: DEDD exonuclease domain-containing protein [Bacteroidota bacterium]
MISLDRPLVVTDTETTGLNSRSNRIIEIAATRLVDGEESISFSQLVDPGEQISYRITRLTGITNAMVYGCPTAAEVIPAYGEFLADSVLVAHNLSFDRGFINAERDRIGMQPIDNQGLCTVRLARRLLPGLRSKSLANLARFFRIPDHGRHRALRDVEITVEVLHRLIKIANEQHGVTELDELISMQSRTYARINPFAKHIVHIRADVLPSVPDTPGVYRMLDGRKKVLYVGKAKALAKRVRSYFNAIEAHPPRIRQLVASIRDIEWTETPTELEALLLESREIRTYDPPFNRAQKRTTPRPYIRIDNQNPYPRVTSHIFPRQDGSLYFGPFRSRGQARSVVELIQRYFLVATCDDREFRHGKRCMRADIGRCSAPCEGQVSEEEYRAEIERICRFIGGDVSDVLQKLKKEMSIAAESLAFEDAVRLRDLYALIDDLVSRHGRVAPEIMRDDAILIYTPHDEDSLTLISIRHGCFLASTGITDVNDRSRILNFVNAAFQETDILPDPRSDADQIRVLMHWLYAHRDTLIRHEFGADTDKEKFADLIVSQISQLSLSTSGHFN